MLPMLFVSGFLLLLGFWTILPPTLLEDTGLFPVSALLAPMFVVHLGTMLNLEEMKKEYKTVIIALAAVIAISLLLFFVGSGIIGQQYAASAAGPISGGLVAVLIVQETAGSLGLENIAIFVTILFVMYKNYKWGVASNWASRK
jgi:Kef-type K+ transport system membrane component KefB